MNIKKLKKLHLGCGSRYLPGYIHIDIDDYDHIDFNTSINDLNMFKNNSVNEIYSSHALEYFDIFEVEHVLEEWKRVLCSGGLLRIAVPDFANLNKVYQQTKDIKNVIGPIMGRWPISDERIIFHKQIFDEDSLKKLLEKKGFINIQRWNFSDLQIIDPDYDDHSRAYFPHMDFENGIHLSLNIICEKP